MVLVSLEATNEFGLKINKFEFKNMFYLFINARKRFCNGSLRSTV